MLLAPDNNRLGTGTKIKIPLNPKETEHTLDMARILYDGTDDYNFEEILDSRWFELMRINNLNSIHTTKLTSL